MAFTPSLTLFVQRSCSELGLDVAHCQPYVDGVKNPKYDQAQQKASTLASIMVIGTGVPQVAVCALLGCLGDAYGRKVPLLSPLVGGLLFALTWRFSESWAFIFTMGAVSSLSGGMYVCNQAAFASLADVTQHASPQDRSRVFGMVEAGIWIGLLAGPIAGGMLTDLMGSQQAFIAPAAVALLNFIITSLTYRETLAHDRRRPMVWKRANPFSALSMFLETRTTVLMGFVLLFGLTSQNGAVAVLSLYVQKVANLDAAVLGLLQSTVFGGSVIGLMIVMPMLVRCLTLPKILVLSCLNGALCWLFMAVSSAVWQLFVGSACLLFAALFFPVVRCGMANTFGSSRYGESLAAVGTLEQVCYLIGPPLLNSIYHSSEASTWRVGGLTVRCLALATAALFYLAAALSGSMVRNIPLESNHLVDAADCQ